MSTVKLELQLSSEELLKAVEQLNQPDLEKFVSQVIILHTQRKSDQLLKAKTELFPENHHDISGNNHSYYNQLRARVEENLTDEEYTELLRLSEQIDKLQAHRLEYLADLANLHGVSLMELMTILGFQT